MSTMSYVTESLTSSLPTGISRDLFVNTFTKISRQTLSSNVNTTNEPSLLLNTNNNTIDNSSDNNKNWQTTAIFILVLISTISVITSAVLGNLLIIISVYRHIKLRVRTNYFVVSLACADMLLAILVMSFKATMSVTKKWQFGKIACDIFNSFDVLFCTASIMHLCCISVDRYYAIIKPLEYPMKITKRRVCYMLAIVWISSAMISFIPIFSGWYSTDEMIEYQQAHPDVCEFKVNPYYSIISSSVSFWIPGFVMIFTYLSILREATRQEKALFETTRMIPRVQKNSTTVIPPSSNNTAGLNSTVNDSQATSNSGHIQVQNQSNVTSPPHRNSHGDDPESGQSTPTKRCINRMKREHKAAKTLGIIMGAFIVCWFPFFLVYVILAICQDSCAAFPEVWVDFLFWVGYFNSSINPVIYAYFNKEFREAFKETIHAFIHTFCPCLRDCACIQRGRNNSAIHFNCTYRSTQDIGLVENKYVKD